VSKFIGLAQVWELTLMFEVPNGTPHFKTFSLIIEGATEKVLQLIKPLKSIYNKSICFKEQKCILKHFRIVKTAFSMSLKKLVMFTFSVLPSLSLCLY
jgi:hypothetical protein